LKGANRLHRDQELRFTVHDSPDYYQLKVSVFNDDKKTDLIGETWVNLQEVVVPGGGQSDIWHNLSCKGKYAGEIRIEITYYDTRPKQEKPKEMKQGGAHGVEDAARDSLKGPREPQTRTPVKRRPLPSDPVTGAPPPSPITAPDHSQTPPRGYQQPPIAAPDHVQTPPRGYQHQQPPPSIPEHVQPQPRGYQPPTAIPEHIQTPPRGYQTPNYIPNQSPLQSVEYSTPQHHFSQSQGHEGSPSMNGYGASPGAMAAPHMPQPVASDRYELHDHVAANDYLQEDARDHYVDEQKSIDPRDQYEARHSPYELPQPDDFGSPPSPDGPPPPPPVHRSRHGSNHVSPVPLMASHGSYDFPSDSRPQKPYETPTHEPHRHSMPTYSQRHSYQPYTPPANEDQFRHSANGNYEEQSPPRHHSYDPRYDHHNVDYGSMQPSVEDAPPSPAGNYSVNPLPRGSGSRVSQYDERRYDQVPSPAPLNLSGRGSAISGSNSASTTPSHQYSNSSMAPSTAPSHQYSNTSMGYTSSNSQASYRDRSQTEISISSRGSYNRMPEQQQQPRRQSEDAMARSSANYLPPVPATLVAGMDPLIAQEISDRIYDEKRASFSQSAGNSPRGRYQDSPQYQQHKPHPLSYHEAAGVPFVSTAATYDERQSRFSTATVPVVKPRAVSPDVRVPRKSVSPSLGAAEVRRLSGVPFGPDSYNALNPSISGSVSTPSLSAKYDIKEIDPDAKIITHDGREIDPSDHIPESNYAPLLESKGPKYASQLPDRNYRPPPSAAQPMPASGRRPLRQAGRPHSMATSSPIYMNNSPVDPSTPTGRNRLQKKTNRMSAQPAPHSSPLAPITPYQDNSYTPRSQPRSSGADYHSTENYTTQYGGSPDYRGAAGPPPIPAKVPMNMHNINGPPPPQPGGGDAWALLEEMKNIDLGSGRARRRGY
jgi:hypothetical protein